jgi:hypothetical protein
VTPHPHNLQSNSHKLEILKVIRVIILPTYENYAYKLSSKREKELYYKGDCFKINIKIGNEIEIKIKTKIKIKAKVAIKIDVQFSTIVFDF